VLQLQSTAIASNWVVQPVEAIDKRKQRRTGRLEPIIGFWFGSVGAASLVGGRT
jgi:hypothetical protein